MALALLAIAPSPVVASAHDAPTVEEMAARHAERERPRHPYLPGPGAAPPSYAPRLAPPAVGPYVSIQANVGAGGANVPGDAANEPSIVVDPTAPNRIAIGWRQFDNVASDFRQAGWAFSRDGGRTWTFPGTLEPGVFRSDPVLDTDATGEFYYMSLKINFQMDLFPSTNGGMTWGAPVPAFGGDKEWIAIDRTGGTGMGHIYTAWQLASPFAPNQFSRSIDGGASFQAPTLLPSHPFFGTLSVASDGALYLCGVDGVGGLSGFHVLRSDDAQNPAVVPSFPVDAAVNLGGAMAFGVPNVNPVGLLGQAWVATKPGSGDVYMLCSVDPPGDDPLDIHFVRSQDRGLTWSAPVRVNDDAADNGAWQWFGTLSVAPNGRIDAIWNDTRTDANNPTPSTSELFYSFSMDGGLTWAPNVPVSPSFNHTVGYPQQQKIGDYYQMISDRLGAHVAYAATHNGEQDVWYLRIGEYDCNGNGVADGLDISGGTSLDCNSNGIPDECDIAAGASTDANGNHVPDECEVIAAELDIKPGACPNPLNPKSRGVLSVVLVGEVDFAVADVDLGSLEIKRSDGQGGSVAPLSGPGAPSPQRIDVATPFSGAACDCHALGADGFDDLMLKFGTEDLAQALELGSEDPGADVKLKLAGSLADGRLFEAEDCIAIEPGARGPAAAAALGGVRLGAGDVATPAAALEKTVGLSGQFAVRWPRPNPFVARLAIGYVTPARGRLWATVHDLLGRRVRTLLDGSDQDPGTHELLWDGKDERGGRPGAGLYLIRFRFRDGRPGAGTEERTVRAVLQR
jgi:hypothetical protein